MAQIDAIPQVQHFSDELGDFHQTGGLVQCLDAVITVDTSIAHLTGALSTPLHLLLAFIPMLVGIYIKHPVFGMRALRYIDSPNTVIGTPPSRVQCAKLTGNLIYIILKLEHTW